MPFTSPAIDYQRIKATCSWLSLLKTELKGKITSWYWLLFLDYQRGRCTVTQITFDSNWHQFSWLGYRNMLERENPGSLLTLRNLRKPLGWPTLYWIWRNKAINWGIVAGQMMAHEVLLACQIYIFYRGPTAFITHWLLGLNIACIPQHCGECDFLMVMLIFIIADHQVLGIKPMPTPIKCKAIPT